MSNGSMTVEPLKVSELIEHLKTLDQDAGVFVYCVDSYYSLAVTKDDITEMDAFWMSEREGLTPPDDAYGRKVAQRKITIAARWELEYKDAGAAPDHSRKISAVCFHAE